MIRDILAAIWDFRVQVLPVALAVALFELPAVLRRTRRLLYVPLYFIAFPLREINRGLSTYLAEDHMYGVGERLTDQELESTRRRIIVTAILSTLIAAVVTPLFLGFVLALYANPGVLRQFLIILVTYKIVTLTHSVRMFHHYAVASARNRALLVFVYAVYLGTVVEMTRTAYGWARPFVEHGDWTGLLSALSAVLFGKVVVGSLMVALATAVFTSLILDRGIREKNLG